MVVVPAAKPDRAPALAQIRRYQLVRCNYVACVRACVLAFMRSSRRKCIVSRALIVPSVVLAPSWVVWRVFFWRRNCNGRWNWMHKKSRQKCSPARYFSLSLSLALTLARWLEMHDHQNLMTAVQHHLRTRPHRGRLPHARYARTSYT